MGIKFTLDGTFQEIDASIRCACSEIIIKARGSEEVIRAKVLIIKENRVFAVCKSCNQEIELPLEKSSKDISNFGPELYLDIKK